MHSWLNFVYFWSQWSAVDFIKIGAMLIFFFANMKLYARYKKIIIFQYYTSGVMQCSIQTQIHNMSVFKLKHGLNQTCTPWNTGNPCAMPHIHVNMHGSACETF